MKADKLTVNRVFDRTERLEAPLFQRPYVWNKEKNLEPLWESIKAIVQKRLDGVPLRPHFLGTMVLDQLSTPTGKINAREIIDGQQRLTTLQLALAAARDFCYGVGEKKYGDAFKKLTENDVPLSEDADDVFKIWPTNADRKEFRAAMLAGSPGALRESAFSEDCLIYAAYLYFAGAFESWVSDNAEHANLQSSLEALYTTLRDDLNLVVIDLEESDDPQEIFETLNALGTPLLPADLVKNFLFRLAQSRKEDAQRLYKLYWEPFDSAKSYWREEVRQGRLKRARLDLFLNNYLTMMRGEETIASQMFSDYRDLIESMAGTGASQHMDHFRSYAEVYRGFDGFASISAEGRFFYRLNEMDVSTLHPLLLEIFKRHGSGEKREGLRQILLDLESFLVRRAVCELTPKNYNRFFAQLVMKLRESNDDFSPGAVRSYLLKETVDTSRWPDDSEFNDAWTNIDFYKRLKKATQRMILEAIEGALYTEKTEKVQVERKLTLEHLLPRDWEEHWPLVVREETAEAKEQALRRRTESKHRIGNLTLLTKALNPSVSNGPWLKKRQAILKHSALNLNRAFQEIEIWNEDAIDQRSKDLFAVACQIWPRP